MYNPDSVNTVAKRLCMREFVAVIVRLWQCLSHANNN